MHATACKRLLSAGGVLTPLVLCCTAVLRRWCRHADFIDEIIAALEESVAEALATPEPEGMKSGVAIYGESDTSSDGLGSAAGGDDSGLITWMDRTLDLPPEGYYEERARQKEKAEVVAEGASAGRRRARL
eukprot:COSAG04_NODE_117_length_25079_cov_46.166213_10_plen_131_part_00